MTPRQPEELYLQGHPVQQIYDNDEVHTFIRIMTRKYVSKPQSSVNTTTSGNILH